MIVIDKNCPDFGYFVFRSGDTKAAAFHQVDERAYVLAMRKKIVTYPQIKVNIIEVN